MTLIENMMRIEVKPTINLYLDDSWTRGLSKFFRFISGKLFGASIRQFENAVAILLAGGVSERWRKSLPNKAEPKHKACAPLGEGLSPIQRTLMGLHRHGIKRARIVLPSVTERAVCEEIVGYLRPYNSELFMSIKAVDGTPSLVQSLAKGFNDLKGEWEGDVIVSYSDIICPTVMLEALMSNTNQDIVVLVDRAWEKNYPDSRTWHDKRYAELAFGHGGKFEDAGEIICSFPQLQTLTPDIQTLLNRDNLCLGEVVGLYKFTRAGREAFLDCCKTVGNGDIPLPNFTGKYELALPEGMTPKKTESIDRILLATFLAYVAQKQKINIGIECVSGPRWFEIDFWEDAKRIERFLPYWDSCTGEISRGAPLES